MHNEWKKFLQGQQAVIDAQGQLRFASAAAEARTVNEQNVIADLSPLGIIRVSGEDASDFLQGQFSNDVKQVDEQTAQLSSYCNPKGRILASFWLYREGDAFYILLPAETLAATLKRLRMFVLMSKVSLEDISEASACLGLAGEDATTGLEQQLGSAPVTAGQSCHHNELTAIRLPGERPRYLITGPVNRLQSLWQAFVQDHTPVGYQAWQLLDIEAGLPSVYAANVEAFVPQMLNLHAIDGVSFKKGCYPGQEIVARMHYLGKLKRRMYRAHIDSDSPPGIGDEVIAPDSQSGQGTGRIVMTSPAPQGGYEVLAVIQVSSAEQGDVHLQSIDGPKLDFIDLPYEVPLEREA
ncbi:folate-binding protein YgfZ [Sulfuriflexus sp.]|uniref:CAF17-like 4Fe-4S cluster assembly/insertion protein YgfZ n=1 Tax=Sulfuriflexus sp. TaxID=2015443 RepID=UPI0028CD48B7|nr:folate-binding protein YgfZ [Sulfuriflexus sp.]MDT8402946.1 folate-binding protein YgfZ [Sulfuriflexus sp.]